ncbi:MAG TPA: hypothetical protein VIW67_15760 [Terriglobales bacterium]
MTHKWFIVLLGILAGSQVPSAGQIPAPQIVLAQRPFEPVISEFRAESARLLVPSLLLSQNFEHSLAHSSLLISGPYERDHGLEGLSPIRKIKTLIFTQSSLPLVQLWEGKVQLDAFQSTLRIQNAQFGALGYGTMPDSRFGQQNFPGGSRSVHLSGISLSFHFGSVGRTRCPKQTWSCVPRIVAALLY